MTPELMQLGNNEAISNALVEIAVGMGKSEDEISAALGAEWIMKWLRTWFFLEFEIRWDLSIMPRQYPTLVLTVDKYWFFDSNENVI